MLDIIYHDYQVSKRSGVVNTGGTSRSTSRSYGEKMKRQVSSVSAGPSRQVSDLSAGSSRQVSTAGSHFSKESHGSRENIDLDANGLCTDGIYLFSSRSPSIEMDAVIEEEEEQLEGDVLQENIVD